MTIAETAGMEAGPRPSAHSKAPLIVVIGADKGGVGKTTIARALIEYVAKHNVGVRAFDTEPGTGVLKRFYPPAEMLDAGTVGGQMRIIDSARADAVTLVDARAGLLSTLLSSFARIRLLDDVRTGALRLLVLHVVGSSVASASEVPGVMRAMQGADLIRVNSHVNPDAVFSAPIPGEVTIDVPNLDETSYAAVDQADSGFAEFVADPEESRVLKGYVRAWLSDVHAQFDRAGLAAMIKPE